MRAIVTANVSPHTGIRSGYFWRMRSASALRFSVKSRGQRSAGKGDVAKSCGVPKGCSSLNLDLIVASKWVLQRFRQSDEGRQTLSALTRCIRGDWCVGCGSQRVSLSRPREQGVLRKPSSIPVRHVMRPLIKFLSASF